MGRLTLDGTSITDLGLVSLIDCVHLTAISAVGTEITDGGIKVLQEQLVIKELKVLKVLKDLLDHRDQSVIQDHREHKVLKVNGAVLIIPLVLIPLIQTPAKV